MLEFVAMLKKIRKIFVRNFEDSIYLDGFQSIGEGVILENNLHFEYKERISLGNYVYLGARTAIYGRRTVTIGDHSIISSDVILLSSVHNYYDAELLPYDQVELISPINIGKSCWIGIRSIILPGVQLDEGCIVGAGSVITKSFKKGAVVAGNPAKLVKYRDITHFDGLVMQEKFYLREKQLTHLTKTERKIPTKKYQ